LNYARIAGTGSYLPEKVLTNADLEQMIETTADWIVERTGVEERHVAAPGETTCDLSEQASRHALEAAGLEARDIDLIIIGTTTPDHVFPSVATQLQHRLGCRGGAAFDVQAVCTGFVYALDIAYRFIRTDGARRVLVVGADTFTRIINWQDRGTCILFGDGAGAVVCVADEQERPVRGILSTYIDADGRYWKDLNIPGGGTLEPPTAESVAAGRHFLRMNGKVIFSQAVRHLSDSCIQAVERAGLGPDDIDLVIPHQANLRIIEAVARRLRISEDRFVINLDTYGNTSAASIPIALDEAVRDGRVTDGTTVLVCGLGAGLTWGASVIRW
jgi:3-oxoacyl-[acyl-carrier-protein] synthase III